MSSGQSGTDGVAIGYWTVAGCTCGVAPALVAAQSCEMIVNDVGSDGAQKARNRVPGLESDLPQYAPVIGANREVNLLDEIVDHLWRSDTPTSCGAGCGDGDDGVEASYELAPSGGMTASTVPDQLHR